MPVGFPRARVLRSLAKARGRTHRYTWIRWAVGLGSTLAIALLPWTGTLRLDLWRGRHLWLGQEVGLVEGLKRFAFPFLAINVAIVLASRFLGRYLCGFVCPVGALNRADEWLRWRWRAGVGRASRAALMLLLAGALAFVAFCFWVDPLVLLQGSPLALTLSWGALLGVTLGLFGIVRGLGFRFCRDWCPSGVYFAVLGPSSLTGVEFANPEACTECRSCERICPSDLKPTQMLAGGEPRAGSGLYPSGLTDLALCLRCGDCIAACEDATGEFGEDTPLRLGFLPASAREEVEA